MWAEVIYSDEDRKFDKDITVGLICSELLNLAEYNVHMAKLLDGGRNKAVTEFAISLIQTLLINDSKVISKLHNFVDALAKLVARLGSPESLQRLVEVARNPAANPATLFAVFVGEDNTRQATEQKAPRLSAASREDYNIVESMEPDPVGFRVQVYQSMKIENLSKMITFFEFSAVEKISVDAVKHNFLAMKVDHMKGVVAFGNSVSITPEVISKKLHREIINKLVELYRESHLGKRQLAYDGRKSVYTAGPSPFSSKDFVIKLVDQDRGARYVSQSILRTHSCY